MTFSIVARVGEAYGVAVASMFVAVGAIVPEVRLGVGAVATQSYARFAYRGELLGSLAAGSSSRDALDNATAGDAQRETRQVGVVGAADAATFAGSDCMPWAGGVARTDGNTAYAIQGNILTGPEVVEAMEAAFLAQPHTALDRRLIAALSAGDAAGGDSRGRQSAAIIVHSPGAGYDGCGIVCDLRVDDHPNAPSELARLHRLNDLYFGAPEGVQSLTGDLADEVTQHLAALGYNGSDTAADLDAWMGVANLEARHSPGGIDARVLEELRRAAAGAGRSPN